jgi:HPt (histidine-containing phosphotransfer) domain-containing protein
MPTRDPAALTMLERVGGPSLVTRMINLFLDHAPRRLADIRAALARRDASALARRDASALSAAAHTLKSSASQLGATDLADLCQRLESADLAQAADLLPDLDAALAAASDSLSRERRP